MRQLTDRSASVGNASQSIDAYDLVHRDRTFVVSFLIFAIAIFAAVVLAPVLEALIVYAFYQHWGDAFAERTNAQRGIISALVPGAVTAFLLIRNKNRRTISKPWSWLRPCVLLFFLSLTIVECAKLVIGGEPVFGPQGQVRSYYVVRSDGSVILSEHGGIDIAGSGREFQPITPENRDWVEAMRREGKRLPKKVDPTDQPWFLPGGQAILFFAETAGKFEFFDRPGRHPETNVELMSVTNDVRQRWGIARQKESAAKEMEKELQDANLRLKRIEKDRQAWINKAAALEAENQKLSQTPVVQQPNVPQINHVVLESPSSNLPQLGPRPALHEETNDMTFRDTSVDNTSATPRVTNRPTITAPEAPTYDFRPPPIRPLHRNCGTRHWRGEWCPRYGFSTAPRIVRRVLRRYRSYHYPSRSCRPRVFLRVCR